MKRNGFNWRSLTVSTTVFLLTACGKSRSPVTEASLTGKWVTVELISPKGNRGPSSGILELQNEFFTNYTYTGVFKWTASRHVTDAEALTPKAVSGTWNLKGDKLHFSPDTNLVKQAGAQASDKPSTVWHEGNLLMMETPSEKGKGNTFILRRDE